MSNLTWHNRSISREMRAQQKKQKPCLCWFTGLSGAGKSTLANAVEVELYKRNHHTYLLDGDNVRHGINKDLAFTDLDRVENIRRIGEVSKLFVDAGIIVLSAFISPFRSDRNIVRSLFKPGEFIEIYVATPLDICEQRDPKGLYKKARRGDIKDFTGVDSPYEAPLTPELVIDTDARDLEASTAMIMNFLETQGYVTNLRIENES